MVGECQWLSSWFEDCDYEIIEIIKKYGLPQEGKFCYKIKFLRLCSKINRLIHELRSKEK